MCGHMSDKKVEIIKNTFLAIFACTPKGMEQGEIEREVNMLDVCGTTGGWQMQDEGDRPDDDVVQCEEYEDAQHVRLYA